MYPFLCTYWSSDTASNHPLCLHNSTYFVFLLSNFLSHLPAEFSHSSTLRLLTGVQDRDRIFSSSRTVKLSRKYILSPSRNVSRSRSVPCLSGLQSDSADEAHTLALSFSYSPAQQGLKRSNSSSLTITLTSLKNVDEQPHSQHVSCGMRMNADQKNIISLQEC
jgi:hypothetical protein